MDRYTIAEKFNTRVVRTFFRNKYLFRSSERSQEYDSWPSWDVESKQFKPEISNLFEGLRIEKRENIICLRKINLYNFGTNTEFKPIFDDSHIVYINLKKYLNWVEILQRSVSVVILF